jgi:ABC-type lipoprotein release transport system permease subunit
MKHIIYFYLPLIFLVILVFTSSVQATGGNCIGCVLATRAVYQVIEYQEPNIEKALNRICNYLPATFSPACKLFIAVEGYDIEIFIQCIYY